MVMRSTGLSGRTRLGGVVILTLAVAVSVAVFARGNAGAESDVVVSPPGDDALAAAAQTPVFFGHQSVGKNILNGIPTVFAAAEQQPPEIVESTSPPDTERGYAHAYIGKNGDPLGKLADFSEKLRTGYGQWARVAFMKFCYLDVVAGTDVDAVFGQYLSTMSQLEQEFPEVAFLHLTVPLTTEPDLKTRLKVALGRGTDHRSNNAAREQFNAKVRAEYGATGRLVDVAAMESTTPDGTRVGGDVGGQPYFALYSGYASDPGHLNDAGSAIVAAGLLEVIGSVQQG